MTAPCQYQASPREARDPELEAYYANRPLMWRNVSIICLCSVGWGMVAGVVGPLMVLRLFELGVRENIQANINSVNLLALSFMVVYFGWKSDRTVSRLGRRKPYLFLSAPFIVVATALFPFLGGAYLVWKLVVLYLFSMFFMDIKACTFPLLNIDCVRTDILARADSVLGMAMGLAAFISMRYTGFLIVVAEWLPYVLGALIMTITTTAAWWIREPPIRYPADKPFKIWATFQVVGQDRRFFWLVAGVAMINGYFIMHNSWIWFWSKETLGLDRGDIFSALSWAGLLNIVLAYPIGWMIDRFGGFRVVILFWLGQLACFLWVLNVHDKGGLIILSLAATMVGPLYAGANIMVYKGAPRKDIGSFTSTCSFFRNGYNALLISVAGWIVHAAGSNFLIGFAIGMFMSTVGLCMFFIYRHLMKVERQGI